MKKRYRIFGFLALFVVSQMVVQVSQIKAIATEQYESGTVTITVTKAIIYDDRDKLQEGEIYLEGTLYYHNTSESIQKLRNPVTSSDQFTTFKTPTIDEVNDGDTIVFNFQIASLSNVTAYHLELLVKESDIEDDDILGTVIITRETLPIENQTIQLYEAKEPDEGSPPPQAEIEIQEMISNRSFITHDNDLFSQIIKYVPYIILSVLALILLYYAWNLYWQSKIPPEMK